MAQKKIQKKYEDYKPVTIHKWSTLRTQKCRLGNGRYMINNLIAQASKLEVKEMPLEHLNIGSVLPNMDNTREYIEHIKSVLESDLSYPIILDDEGEIMDGRHRITKALIEGKTTIKYVRFEETPYPDYFEDEK